MHERNKLSNGDLSVLTGLESLWRDGFFDIADKIADAWLRRKCAGCEEARRMVSYLRLAAQADRLCEELFNSPALGAINDNNMEQTYDE